MYELVGLPEHDRHADNLLRAGIAEAGCEVVLIDAGSCSGVI